MQKPKHFYGKGVPGVDLEQLRGQLIVVEGADGSGRSTQMDLLRNWLERRGYPTVNVGLKRSMLVSRELEQAMGGNILGTRTLSLFYATDFADQLENVIIPALRSGFIVLADRYIYTLMARAVVRGVEPTWIRKLYSYAVKPDVTFFFDVPLKTALARILDGRTRVKYHEAGMDMGYSKDPYESFRIFQGKINQEYKRMVREYDFIKIDAVEPPDVQQTKVREIQEAKIDLPRYRWHGPVFPRHLE